MLMASNLASVYKDFAFFAACLRTPATSTQAATCGGSHRYRLAGAEDEQEAPPAPHDGEDGQGGHVA